MAVERGPKLRDGNVFLVRVDPEWQTDATQFPIPFGSSGPASTLSLTKDSLPNDPEIQAPVLRR